MKRAFTIIEVLVVIGIITILTAIILPSINGTKARNRDSEKIADIAAIQLGLQLYYSQHLDLGYPQILEQTDFQKYVTADSLISPDDQEYLYVPLKTRIFGSNKCTYYHLGVMLESSKGQIDEADQFSSVDLGIGDFYDYCGDNTDGIDGTQELMYDVHP